MKKVMLMLAMVSAVALSGCATNSDLAKLQGQVNQYERMNDRAQKAQDARIEVLEVQAKAVDAAVEDVAAKAAAAQAEADHVHLMARKNLKSVGSLWWNVNKLKKPVEEVKEVK